MALVRANTQILKNTIGNELLEDQRFKHPVLALENQVNVVLNGVQTIDGKIVQPGNRVAVFAQTDLKQNGIYLTSADAWERVYDFKINDHVGNATFTVSDGDTHALQTWQIINQALDDMDRVGIDDIKVFQISGPKSILSNNGLTVFDGLSLPVDQRTFNNGLVQLGGTLTKDTIIDVDDFQLENIWTSASDINIYNKTQLSGEGNLFESSDGTFVSKIGTSAADFPLTMMTALVDGSKFTGLSVKPEEFMFLAAQSDWVGAIYDKDYSTTFVDNSLISKKYADDLVANNVVQVDNGLSVVDGKVELGGTLTKNTFIDANMQTFEVSSSDPNNADVFTKFNTHEGKTGISSSDGIKISGFISSPNLCAAQASLVDDSQLVAMTLNPNDIQFKASENDWKGVTYDKDYSPNFVDNSLISKKYADDLVLGATDGNTWVKPVRALVDGVNVTGNVALTGENVDVDGIILVDGDLVGVFDQTDPTENGVYIVTASGAWIRSSQWAVGQKAAAFTFMVNHGIVNADKQFTVTNNFGDDEINVKDLTLIQTGGKDFVQADNCLSVVDGKVELGGTINKNTTIEFKREHFLKYIWTEPNDIRIKKEIEFSYENILLRNTNEIFTSWIALEDYPEYPLTLMTSSNGDSKFTSLTIRPEELIFLSGQNDWKGVTYDKDYSANFVDSSLISKKYVDNLVLGATDGNTWVKPVRALVDGVNVTGNVALTGENVDVDGIILVDGDLVGVFDQTDPTENGVYIVTASGAWIRSSQWAVGQKAAAFTFTVNIGTNADKQFSISTVDCTIGTGPLNIYQSGGKDFVQADNGLSIVDDKVELGGTLIKDTTLQLDTNLFSLNSVNSDSSVTATLEVKDGIIDLNSQGVVNDNKFSITPDNIIFSGVGEWNGVIYDKDYSTNFTSESLISKKYVDTLIKGRRWKNPVRALVDGVNVTGNIALTGAITIDDVILADGDLVGVFNQTDPTENGVYVVNISGAWSRTSTWSINEKSANFTFFSNEGTQNADCEFTVTNDDGNDIIGTHTLIVSQTAGQSTISAGAGLIRNTNNFDLVATDLSLKVNADDVQVNIGTTNGTSLEVTDSGLELPSEVIGERKFSHTNTEVYITENNITFLDNEIKNATSTSVIPLTITPTIDYGNGNGTNVGDIINQFRTEFTDEAIINALVQLKADINQATSAETKYNETTTIDVNNQKATLDVAPSKSFTNALVFLNGIRLILTADYTITNTTTGEITLTSQQIIKVGDIIIIDYIDK